MTNINLFESAQGKNSLRRDGTGIGKELTLPIVVLAIVLVIFGLSKLYLMYLNNGISKVEEEKQTEAAAISGKNVDRVADFDGRMTTALTESSSGGNYGEYLTELENLMVAGARVDSLTYSKEGVELVMVADNFKTVARQAMSFKNSKYFKDLKMGKTSRDESGNIEFDLKK